MLARQILLGILGLSFGVGTSAGLFSFIIGLGVVSDFADRTHTAEQILLYEDSVALGGIVGGIYSIYQIPLPSFRWILALFGLFGGVFVGCWAMAIAEVLNVFPIFMRRTKTVRYIAVFILSLAIGKGVGSLLSFTLLR